MIIDYRIIRTTDHNALASDVKEALATGWEPVGNLVTALDTSGRFHWFYQVMIKHQTYKFASLAETIKSATDSFEQ